MKKIIVTLIISASLISFNSHAQSTGKQKPSMQQMKTMLKDSLHLTDVQVDSVVAIRTEFGGQIKTISQDQSLSQDQKKQKLQPIKEQMKARLKTILTKEQLQKMMEMQHEMRGGKMNDSGDQ